MVEFADFNHGPMETPMTEPTLPLIELLQKQDDGDFLRAVAEAVLQLLMEHDVEGVVGAGRYERGDGRQTWRNGYRDRELKTRLGALNPAGCRSCGRARTSRAFLSRAGPRRRRWSL
jgi:putative transposase